MANKGKAGMVWFWQNYWSPLLVKLVVSHVFLSYGDLLTLMIWSKERLCEDHEIALLLGP